MGNRDMRPEDVMEYPGQFSSEFNRQATMPYLEVFGRIPPAEPWARFRCGMDGLEEALDVYMEGRDAERLVRRAYASMSILLNSVQRITANIDSVLTEEETDRDMESLFKLRRWAAVNEENPNLPAWEPDRYAEIIISFLKEIRGALRECSPEGGMRDVIRLASYEKRIIWTIIDLPAAYERIR